MKDIGALFRGLEGGAVGGEVLSNSRVLDSILRDSAQDVASVYTGYSVRFGAHLHAQGMPVAYGSLVPNQVIPMWQRCTNGKQISWEQLAALQIMCWSAVTYGGKLWLADTDADKQSYDLALPSDELLRVHPPGKHKLMSPGGRMLVNVWEDFPCCVPFQKAPVRQLQPRVCNAMSPATWLGIFGNAEVHESGPITHPTWRLVEMVDMAEEDTIPPDGCDVLYDPVVGSWMVTRDLPLPIGFEYAERILNVNVAPRTLRDVLFLGIQDYITKNGNIQQVGFAWHDAEGINAIDGNAAPADALTNDTEATRQLVYKTTLDEKNKIGFSRLDSEQILPRFQNGVYDPDLA